MKKLVILGVLLLGLAIPIPAMACVDENGNKVPCEKPAPPPVDTDPPPGGGNNCWGLTCTQCGTEQHPVLPDIEWDVCDSVMRSGGCGCNWKGDKCVGQHGTCVYTG